MIKYFLLIFSTAAFADSDPLFTKITYYDGLGEKFRVETASKWPKCVEAKRARKIILDKTNELREVAYWDAKGEMHGAGKNNNPHVHKIVNEIFAKSQVRGNPCEDPMDSNQSGAGSTESKSEEIEFLDVDSAKGRLE